MQTETGELVWAPQHHMYYDETDITDDNRGWMQMNPPLRTKEDQEAIIEGLRDGAIDIIATDHAPHTDYEKDQEFDYAPNGILGLETALPVTLDVLMRKNRFKLPKVIDLMTRKPAEFLKPPAGTLSVGAAADICTFDLNERWIYDAKAGFSKSSNSPWHGEELRGRIKTTIVDGKIVYDGKTVKARS